MVNTKKIADDVITQLKSELPLLLGKTNKIIKSVCVAGSYVRGDFISHNSDIDFYIVYQPGTAKTAQPDYSLLEGNSTFNKIINLINKNLGDKNFISHSPFMSDCVPLPWEWLPNTQDEISLPKSNANIRLLNIFLFDFLENLMVLWGDDPRHVLPEPLPVSHFTEKWFHRVITMNETRLLENKTKFIPHSVFNSIHVAQIFFGETTLDKLLLLDQYEKYVPSFPGKSFGSEMILQKQNQQYPDKPFIPKPAEEYVIFEKQLAAIVLGK